MQRGLKVVDSVRMLYDYRYRLNAKRIERIERKAKEAARVISLNAKRIESWARCSSPWARAWMSQCKED